MYQVESACTFESCCYFAGGDHPLFMRVLQNRCPENDAPLIYAFWQVELLVPPFGEGLQRA
jgi:hypothetical protein